MLNVDLGSTRCEFTIWQPSDGRIFDAFAFDTETTEIVESRPDLVPHVVLATAFDGERGVLIHRDDLLPFFEAHQGVPFIGHNISFDLAVSQTMVWRPFRHLLGSRKQFGVVHDDSASVARAGHRWPLGPRRVQPAALRQPASRNQFAQRCA